jgi:hypothetical protein
METIILSWIFNTITSVLRDITKEHDVVAHQIWHTIEHQFISNSEMRALHLDAMFHNFIQGDLSVSDYYRKMKNMADLSCAIFDRNLILNVLQGRNLWYGHLRTIIMHNMPFPSFHKIRDDLVLEELTLDPDMPAPPSQVFYSNNTPAPPTPALSHPPGNGG